MRTFRVLATALVAAVLVSGCSSSKDDSARSATTETTQEVAPPLETSGTADPVEVLKSALEFQNWLFANPDPSLLSRYMDPKCACFIHTKQKLDTLSENGWRTDGKGISVQSVRLVSTTGRTAVVYAVVESNERPIVDRNGKVIEEGPKTNPLAWNYTLERGLDDKWRIADVDPAGPVSP